MNSRLQALADAGVSIWLDDLSRERLASGNLAQLVADSGVVGVTTNPTIFAGALANGERYAEQIKSLKASGTSVDDVVFELTTTDVQQGRAILRPVYDATNGAHGRVSTGGGPGERGVGAGGGGGGGAGRAAVHAGRCPDCDGDDDRDWSGRRTD